MSKKRQPLPTKKRKPRRGRPPKAIVPVVPEGFTDKERRFVEEYCIDFNATDAARRAGYSKKSAEQIGNENRAKPRIAAAIEDYLRRKSQRSEKTREDYIAEMEKLAFANILDYFSLTSDGSPFIDLSAVTRDQAAALVEIQVDDYVDGRGEDARDVKRTRIKTESKRQALMDGAKLKGFVKDTVKHEGEVTVRDDSAKIKAEIDRLDDERARQVAAFFKQQVEQRRAFLLTLGGASS